MTQFAPHPGIGEAGERYIVVSMDGHDSPPSHPEKFREYFEAKHLPAFEDGLKTASAAAEAVMVRATGKEQGGHYDDDPYRNYWNRILVESFGMDVETARESVRLYRPSEPESTDPIAHMALVEASGVVGELLYSGGAFEGLVNSHSDPDFVRATEVAYLRWLADYCNAVPGRVAGVNPTSIKHIDQLDAAIKDIRWGRDHGLFGGVRLPSPGPRNKGLPPLVDPAWDKLWSVCAELRLPLIAHEGLNAPPDAEFAYGEDPEVAYELNLLELGVFSKRTFWHLIASGAFDRHPDLKFGLVEHQIGSLAGILHELDQVFQSSGGARIRRRHKMIPSAYWYNHGFVASPFLDAVDARKHRHEIGLETLMWGGDFPHPEGSFPYYRASMRHSLGGLPEHEIRAILAGNALRIFDFDLAKLRAAANRVGPTVEELSTPLPAADVPPHATAWAFAPYRMRTLEGA